jgi:hypothetical protein
LEQWQRFTPAMDAQVREGTLTLESVEQAHDAL